MIEFGFNANLRDQILRSVAEVAILAETETTLENAQNTITIESDQLKAQIQHEAALRIRDDAKEIAGLLVDETVPQNQDLITSREINEQARVNEIIRKEALKKTGNATIRLRVLGRYDYRQPPSSTFATDYEQIGSIVNPFSVWIVKMIVEVKTDTVMGPYREPKVVRRTTYNGIGLDTSGHLYRIGKKSDSDSSGEGWSDSFHLYGEAKDQELAPLNLINVAEENVTTQQTVVEMRQALINAGKRLILRKPYDLQKNRVFVRQMDVTNQRYLDQ